MNINKQVYGRLQEKTLKNRLIIHLLENYGYQDKPKVAEALVVDLLSLHNQSTKDVSDLKPGQILWPVVLKTEKNGNRKTLAKTKSKQVILSVVADSDIIDYAQGKRPLDILPKRVARIIWEAYQQGGLLTQADIALIFNQSQSKISQLVLAYQRQKIVLLPLRGVIQDIGPSITHKVKIIQMHTQNYSTLDIARATSHAPSSVDRYINDFQRVKLLYEKKMGLSEIAYLTSLSEHLVSEYVKIVKDQLSKN
ncbi:MAG: DUF1670 domain-containing protein [Atribacterota bacterium]